MNSLILITGSDHFCKHINPLTVQVSVGYFFITWSQQLPLDGLTPLGCYSGIPLGGCLMSNRNLFSKFCRLEVQDQGARLTRFW